MTTITLEPNEQRADYLSRVIYAFMHETSAGNESIIYDEVECDGHCLADDIASELSYLTNVRDELLGTLKAIQSGQEFTPEFCKTLDETIARIEEK